MKPLFIRLFIILTCQIVRASELIPIQTELLLKSSTSWNGSTLKEYNEGIPEISIIKATIQPGAKVPPHKHIIINAGVLLSGQLTVISENNNILTINAGDPIIELIDTYHYAINSGTEPATLIIFYAGVKGDPVSIPLGEI